MEFLNPKFLTEAFEVLDKRKSELQICAGMTHLLRCYPSFPEEISNRRKGILHIGDLSVLSECREENSRYVLGATARISSLESDAYLARYAPAVLDAAHATSTPQVRNRRTIGGEIAWGSYHSPLIAVLMSLRAKVKVRIPGEHESVGREESIDLEHFYEDSESVSSSETTPRRKAKLNDGDLILKVVLPRESLAGQGVGLFSFFRALTPKISTENSGVVIAVSGTARNGIIEKAQLVASGLWMTTLDVRLPLEGVKMSDAIIFEKLYSFCDRYPFDKYRRSGPSGSQLGLVVFGLMKEGFSGLLGR